MGWVTKLLGMDDTISKGLDLADQYIEDKDERNRLKAGIITKRMELDGQKTHPIFDGIHKLGRQLLSAGLAYMYYKSHMSGNPIPIEGMLAIIAPGTAYIWQKGTGR